MVSSSKLHMIEKTLTRRRFLKYAFRLSALSFLGFGFAGRNNLTVEKHDLVFSNFPEAFDGLTIVQISDLHASFWVGRNYLNHVVDRINALPKDLFVITGDIITGAVNDFWKRWLPNAGGNYISMVIEVLSRLKEGPKLAVLGNHDQWDGKETEQRLVGELESIGIRVLRNQSQSFTKNGEAIHIAGTDDVWFSSDIHRALRDVPRDDFKIVLSHSPDIRTDIRQEDKIDLLLCGHTHGGQVAIPYLSHHFIPIRNPKRYLAGLVKEHYGYTYVNRGIGTLVFPLRIAATPEITSIKLIRS